MWITSTLLAIGVVLILIAAPILKYFIHRYDIEYLGREVEIESCHVNLFTGAIQLDRVKIFELNSSSVFIMAKEVKLQISIFQLVFKNCNLNKLEIEDPFVKIIKKSF